MEPSSAPASPERGPQPTPGPEQMPSTPDATPSPEFQGPAPQEVAPASREAANQNHGMTLPPVQHTAQQMVSEDPPVTQMPPADPQPQAGGPAVADDADVIEKEWVNKAKSIINNTRDNPYVQEQEVSRLQADYLKKRYGKDIKPAKG